jgi:hypothetical protein
MSGGRVIGGGLLGNVGTIGFYWSSTVSGVNSRRLGFNSGVALMGAVDRVNGNSVRCLKD